MSQVEKPLAAGYGPCSALEGLAGFEGRVAMSTGGFCFCCGGWGTENRQSAQAKRRPSPALWTVHDLGTQAATQVAGPLEHR